MITKSNNNNNNYEFIIQLFLQQLQKWCGIVNYPTIVDQRGKIRKMGGRSINYVFFI